MSARRPASRRATPTAAPGHASLDEALAIVADHALAPPQEDVPAGRAVGRILASDVTAKHDHPRLDHSAMDGFAVRASDLPGPLRIVGESRAGSPLSRAIRPGESARISTGATLPPGADAVLRLEDAREARGVVETSLRLDVGRDVRRRGEDLTEGDVLLGAGAVVSPHSVTALVASGNATASCHRPVRVAVLTSGDELVDHAEPAAAHQVADANGPGVVAQSVAAGAEVVAVRRVRDERAVAERAVAELLAPAGGGPPDLLVTIGAISVGAHDHMRGALDKAGVTPLLWGVAVRPGHPLWLGRAGLQRVLGLPGNPVSAAICFHVFGLPLMGLPSAWNRSAPLASAVTPSPRRTDLLRCRFQDGALAPLARQGSHDVSSLAAAEAIAWIRPGASVLPAGTAVRYQLLG